jgi:hypothetical protein
MNESLGLRRRTVGGEGFGFDRLRQPCCGGDHTAPERQRVRRLLHHRTGANLTYSGHRRAQCLVLATTSKNSAIGKAPPVVEQVPAGVFGVTAQESRGIPMIESSGHGVIEIPDPMT